VTEYFSCPTCDNGFVEELGGEEQSLASAGNQEERHGHNNEQEPRPPPRIRMRAPIVRPIRIHHRRRNRRAGGITLTIRGNNGESLGTGRRQVRLGHQLMQSLLFNGPGFNFRAAGGGIPALGLGDRIGLGDYVFGSSGHLNAILNRLMADSDQDSGVPAMEKEKIDSIPTVLLTQEQKEKNSGCCVCWEDLDGEVRLLECGHCFHSDCIVPWLELHGTCPMCRKLLGNSTSNSTVSIESSLSSTSSTGSPYFTTASIASSTSTSSSSPIWTMDREMTEGSSHDESPKGEISNMNNETQDERTVTSPSIVTTEEVSTSGETKTHSIIEESRDISSSVNTNSFNNVISVSGTETNVPVPSTSCSPDGSSEPDKGSASKKLKLDSSG